MIKDAAKSFLNFVWNLKKGEMKNRIIYYHSVHPDKKRAHRPDFFEQQLKWLKRHNYSGVLVKDIPKIINNELMIDKPWVVITFDDGYRDNLEVALPMLKKIGFCATFFIASKYVSSEKPRNSKNGHRLYEGREMLTDADLVELHENGMEIASHTCSHKMATKVCEESPDKFLEELRDSKRLLENVIGDSITSFSYPNGQKGAFSEETKNLLEKCNYEVGCTTIWGSVNKGNMDILELPRCEISCDDDLAEFAAKMTGQRDYLRVIHKTLDQSKAWSD